MIHTYLTLEYISLVIFGLILVIFSIGSFYLSNIDNFNYKVDLIFVDPPFLEKNIFELIAASLLLT